MRRQMFIILALAAVVLALAAAGKDGAGVFGGGRQPVKDQLQIVLPGLPESLDPAKNSSYDTALPITGIYEGLVRLNPQTLAPEPCLAESWSVSEDGKRWTFYLRQGIQFSDGTDCDAEAIKASMARSMVLKESEPYPALVFSPVSSIESDGRYSLSFILKYPFSPFLKNLALPFAAPVVSPGALSRHRDNFWQHPSGTGPFMLKEFGRDKIVLQPNPHYRGGNPPTAGLVFTAAADPGLRAARLLDGSADIILDPGRENLEKLSARNMQIVTVPAIDVSYIGFYTDRPPFNNKFLRIAVACSLDREIIVERVLGGEGLPASGLVPPPVSDRKTGAPPKISPGEARRILAREGYPGGLDVVLATYRDSRRYCPPGGEALAGEIKRQLEPAGIRVTIQSRTWQDHKKAIDEKAGHFFLYGWTGDNGDADNFMYTLLASSQAGHGLNASGYQNPRLDVLLATARSITDAGTRKSLYGQGEELVLDDVPLTALNHGLVRAACRPQIKDISLSGFGLIDLHSLKKEK